MKLLHKFLSSATNKHDSEINPIIFRILLFITGSLWFFSSIWFLYSIVISTNDFLIYYKDKQILKELSLAVKENPRGTHLEYFRNFSDFNGVGFNPNNPDNYKNWKASFDSKTHPVVIFLLYLIPIIFINFIWWFLLKIFFWIKFGSNSNY
jgi:hypothetical protein